MCDCYCKSSVKFCAAGPRGAPQQCTQPDSAKTTTRQSGVKVHGRLAEKDQEGHVVRRLKGSGVGCSLKVSSTKE